MTLISVILPTYNRADIIGQTIQSILNQTYQRLELIIIDDGSTDNTEAVVRLFDDKRIKYIKTENWGGPARPRNVGISQAKGDYIAFCDHDDIWMKNKLEIQLKIFRETSCDLLSSNTLYFADDVSNITGRSQNRKIKNIKDFINQNQICTSTVLVRNTKELFFNEDKNLIGIEDYALWLDLFIKGMVFEFINQPLVFYRAGHDSVTMKNWRINNLKNIYLSISLLLQNPNLPIKLIVFRKIFKNYYKYWFKNIAKNKIN